MAALGSRYTEPCHDERMTTATGGELPRGISGARANDMAPVSALRFDLRRAPFSTVSQRDQYGQCVEMSRWADARGFSSITISEHHGVDFISAPTALAGVLLGAT